jgi:hypothetical protein
MDDYLKELLAKRPEALGFRAVHPTPPLRPAADEPHLAEHS